MSTYKHYYCDRPDVPVKVLLVGESSPDNPNNYFYNLNSGNRSFFDGVMKAFGFRKDKSARNEKKELYEFLVAGYFLIDSCPEPINNIERGKRIKKIYTYKESLAEVINDLKPEKIVFLCKTNEKVAKWIENNSSFGDRIIKNKDSFSFPYPGNGWLTRKDGKGLMQLLPSEVIFNG